MRILIGALCCLFLVTGCAKMKFLHPKHKQAPQAESVVTPDFRVNGKIKIVNQEAGYVIASFPTTNVPQIGQKLSVYHDGQKTAELKITGPEPRDGNAVADIITGSAVVGDEVKEQQ